MSEKEISDIQFLKEIRVSMRRAALLLQMNSETVRQKINDPNKQFFDLEKVHLLLQNGDWGIAGIEKVASSAERTLDLKLPEKRLDVYRAQPQQSATQITEFDDLQFDEVWYFTSDFGLLHRTAKHITSQILRQLRDPNKTIVFFVPEGRAYDYMVDLKEELEASARSSSTEFAHVTIFRCRAVSLINFFAVLSPVEDPKVLIQDSHGQLQFGPGEQAMRIIEQLESFGFRFFPKMFDKDTDKRKTRRNEIDTIQGKPQVVQDIWNADPNRSQSNAKSKQSRAPASDSSLTG